MSDPTNLGDGPVSAGPWWRRPPLWIGAGPLLAFLVLAAVDLTLAQQFTSSGKAIVSGSLGGLWQWMVLLLIAITTAITNIYAH